MSDIKLIIINIAEQAHTSVTCREPSTLSARDSKVAREELWIFSEMSIVKTFDRQWILLLTSDS